jgi:hypothetical protein
MKKPFIFLLASAGLLLAQSPQKPPSDAELRAQLIGTWHREERPAPKGSSGMGLSQLDSTYTFAPGGTFQHNIKVVVNKLVKQGTTMGTWQIQDNFLITTITNFPPERKIRPEAAVAKQAIIKLTPTELTLEPKNEKPDVFKRIK